MSETVKFEFWGHSDDVTVMEMTNSEGKTFYADEFYPQRSVMLKLKAPTPFTGGLTITAVYNGCWSFGVGPYDEGVSMHGFSDFAFEINDNEYSARLSFFGPSNCDIERVDGDEDGY